MQVRDIRSTLVVEGGHRLAGSVAVEGNKNAALPLLAACLLTEETCELTNVPRIKDVTVMGELAPAAASMGISCRAAHCRARDSMPGP